MWSSKIVELLAFVRFLVKIYVVLAIQQLVDLLLFVFEHPELNIHLHTGPTRYFRRQCNIFSIVSSGV